MKKDIIKATFTLVGFIVGAGVLSLPYVIAKSGFIIGITEIILIGIATLTLNLYLGEVVLKTKGIHQLTGYAKIYLGSIGRTVMSLCMISGMYGALIAYLIKESEFLSLLFNLPRFPALIIFFTIMSIIVYSNLKFIEESEFVMVSLLLIILTIMFILSFPSINLNSLSTINLSKIHLPYGVILFAFLGFAAIPELREELGRDKKLLKKAIIVGSSIPIFIYILFVLTVISISKEVTDGALIGLAKILPHIFFLALSFGILTIATSFIAVALALRELYYYDFKLPKLIASTLTCSIPFIITLLILNTRIGNPFYRILDISGSITGSLTGILIILIFLNAKKHYQRRPEYTIKHNKFISYLLLGMFILGLIQEFIFSS